MARRRNSVYNRFQKMRGLPAEERSLLLRLGNLMDAALNNRQSSNPFEASRISKQPRVYPPTGLLAKIGIQNIKLVWDPPDNIQLLRYEITFLNITTGETTVVSSYTSEVSYKAPPGSYKATVRAVGRNGEASLVQETTFQVADEIMQIEGAKNEPTELGTMVQDSIILKAGQSVYAWGSVVLDKYIAGLNVGNHNIVFRLWAAPGANADFSEATLQQTISLYPATESASCLDDTALGGLITRPLPLARAGSFETSQSVMFSPLEVEDEDDMTTVTFFLQAVNREIELDEVGLSLVLWSGDHGFGSAVPGDPFVAEPADVLPHVNSFHVQEEFLVPDDNTNSRHLWGFVPDGYSLIGNQYSIGFWIRFDDLDATKISQSSTSGADYGTKNLFSKNVMRTDRDKRNAFNLSLAANNNGGGNYEHLITVSVTSADGLTTRLTRYLATATGSRKERSAFFPDGDAATGIGDDGWYFIAVCFSGGLFTGGIPKTRLYISRVGDVAEQFVPSTDQSLNPILCDDTGKMQYSIGSSTEDAIGGTGCVFEGVYNGDKRTTHVNGLQYHRLGIWNKCIDAIIGITEPIDYITNGGIEEGWAADPTTRNWKTVQENFEGINEYKNYRGDTLVHENKFGAIEEPFESGRAGRDTGQYIWGGDLNWTQVIDPYREPSGANFHKIEINGTYVDQSGNSWTDNSSIADVLSPYGLNGTTLFGYAHPGQDGVIP